MYKCVQYINGCGDTVTGIYKAIMRNNTER